MNIFEKNPQLYNQITCRKCRLLIEDCQCKPTPCPFCFDEYFWINEWNNHLSTNHKKIQRKLKKIWAEPSTSYCID